MTPDRRRQTLDIMREQGVIREEDPNEDTQELEEEETMSYTSSSVPSPHGSVERRRLLSSGGRQTNRTVRFPTPNVNYDSRRTSTPSASTPSEVTSARMDVPAAAIQEIFFEEVRQRMDTFAQHLEFLTKEIMKGRAESDANYQAISRKLAKILTTQREQVEQETQRDAKREDEQKQEEFDRRLATEQKEATERDRLRNIEQDRRNRESEAAAQLRAIGQAKQQKEREILASYQQQANSSNTNTSRTFNRQTQLFEQEDEENSPQDVIERILLLSLTI